MNDRVHHLLSDPPELSRTQFRRIFEFVKFSLTDQDAHPSRLMHLVPASVPSGLEVHRFEVVPERPECAI